MTRIPRLYNRHHKNAPQSAVYIGRGSPYGNPYVIGEDGDRATVFLLFETVILPHLDVSALAGKDLWCYCHPLQCHGDSILRKANPDIDFDAQGPGNDKLGDLVQACEEVRTRKQYG